MAVTGREQRAGYPLTWKIREDVMPNPSWVKISQIRALPTDRLGSLVGRLGDESVQTLVDELVQLIG